MGLRGIGAKPVKSGKKHPGIHPGSRETWRKPGLTRAERVIKFIQSLMITSGPFAGTRFRLRPWQKRIIRAIYAVDAKGRRVKRSVLISIPRKNGKTALAAALAMCHLVGPESEPRGAVFSAASDRQQAALIFREMIAFVRASPRLSDRIVIREHNKTLEDRETRSMYSALSSDAKKAHGLNVSFAVMDELAQWPDRELFDAITTGGAARAEPLFVTISTKSHDPNHVMSELIKYGERVRDGEIDDPSFLPVIYGAPDDADPWSENTWRACNPALGDFRSLPELQIAAAQAKRLPAREPAFRLLYLNQPIDAETHFLNRVDWDACRSEIDISELAGQRCILGLDLSSTTDLTALAAYFPDSGSLLAWFWLPADNLEEAERRDHVPYRLWVRQGFLETTPGRAIDKAFVVHRIGEIVAEFDVQVCAFDRWRVEEVKRLMADEGIEIEMTEHGQGWKDMAPSIDAFETAVLRRNLHHNGHPVLTMCMANAVTVSDPTGARKLVKEKSIGRIDGTIASVMAIGQAARQPEPPHYQFDRSMILSA